MLRPFRALVEAQDEPVKETGFSGATLVLRILD